MQTSDSYEFGPYRLDTEGRVLTRGNQVVPLTPKSFDLLAFMVRSPGRAFSKKDLITALWPDTFVEEANLSFQISTLRKVLDDGGRQWIETVPKHGYRFVGDVRTVEPLSSPRLVVRKTWIVGLIAAAAILAVSFYAAFQRPHTDRVTSPAMVAVPLTSYPGFEGTPSLSPDGSQIAFTWDGPDEDNRDIYVKLTGPGGPLRLTTDPRWDGSPAWSPDGRSIAFQRVATGGTIEVIVIPALGGAERVVTTLGLPQAVMQRPRSNPAWTPDSKWIAVGGRPSGETSTGIWLIGLENGERRRLTEVGHLDAGDGIPAISPDGRYLAFIRVRQSAMSAVYVLALSSTLTSAGQPTRVTAESPNIGGLAWSPDGRSLVFASGAHASITSRLRRVAFTPTPSEQPAEPEILPFGEQATAVTISKTGRLVYAIQSRDAALWKLPLTKSNGALVPVPVASSTYDEHTPDYSPDGKQLAFTSNRSGTEEIWIADADGSNPQQMTSMKGPLCANPRWSPDGRTILFNSRREGSADLYLLTPETGDVRRITDDPFEEVEPRWSRDGRSIYFGSNRTSRPEVWRTSAGGGQAVRITQHGGLAATESPDGRFLYYAKRGGPPTSIWQVPVGGGEEKLVVEGLSNSLNFVVADRGLYFLALGAAAPGPQAQVLDRARQPTTIDFFEFATKKRTTLFVVGKQAWVGMALFPDQRSLLYSVVDSAGSNLMLVDKFK